MSISNIRFTAALALLVAGSFLPACTHLVYHPSDLMYVGNPKVLDGLREEVEFHSTDGTKLAGWFLKARKKLVDGRSRGTVVQFHGNAQNMTAHFASLVWLVDEGYDLFAFDYRGYGISEGKPSQEGLNRDALAAIRYVENRVAPRKGHGTGPERDVTLYGQSLGGAVLLRAFDEVSPAERERVRAIVVEGTFDNYHSIARSVLARSWLTFLFQPLAYVLVSDEYGPEDSIARIAPVPLLVIHGDQDPVVPIRFGREIFRKAREPKQFWEVEGGHHIDAMGLDDGKWRGKLVEYLEKQNRD